MLNLNTSGARAQARTAGISRRLAAHHLALAAVIALSVCFEFFRLNREGFAKLYYAVVGDRWMFASRPVPGP